MKTITIKNQLFLFIALGVMGIVHSCSIPKTVTREAHTELPNQFQKQVVDTVNTAQVSWNDFFEDSLLTNWDYAIPKF